MVVEEKGVVAVAEEMEVKGPVVVVVVVVAAPTIVLLLGEEGDLGLL